jgi:hypothetical protein
MERRPRLLVRIYAGCGALLVPWIVVLIEQLHGQAGKRSFDSSWMGSPEQAAASGPGRADDHQ